MQNGKFEKTELLKKLEEIQLTNKNTLTKEYEQVVFITEPVSGVVSYNGRMCVFAPIEHSLDFSTDSTFLLNTVRAIDSDFVYIEVKKDKVVLSDEEKSIKAEFALMEHTNLIEIVKSVNFDMPMKKVPEDFFKGLRLCRSMMQENLTKGKDFLRCLSINEDRISSSDNLRISLYEMEKNFDEVFQIGLTETDDLLKMTPTKEYAITPTWIYFKTMIDTFVAIRNVCIDFPEVAELFDFEGDEFEIIDALKTAIDSLHFISADAFFVDKSIEVTIDKKGVLVRAEKIGVGWVEKFVPYKYDLKAPVTFGINPHFTDIFKKTSNMKLSEDNTRAMFMVDNFYHLVTLKKPKKKPV